jgi:hypothetical protein
VDHGRLVLSCQHDTAAPKSVTVRYSTIEANAFEQVKDQTRLMMESAQTIRDYTSKEITPLLDNLKE